MTRRVVITGMGAVTPLGVGASTLLERWMAGESGIEDGLGRCSDFDPAERLSKKEVRRADRFTQLAIAACDEALEQAGWHEGLPCDAERAGCILGTGIGGIETIENQHDVLRDKGGQHVSPLSVPLMMGNAAAGVLAIRNGLQGPSHSVVSACAAGSDAIGEAMRLIRSGDADAVVTGGSEAALTPLSLSAFAAMGATSESGRSCPFDARRDGFVMGEGAGVLVLEDAELAEARGAEVLGEVLGYGASADAHHITAPEPTGGGAARAIERALRDAGIDPAEVVYVNAHGTSTPLNDKSETGALKSALGEDVARGIPVSSTKSAIGHLLGAAGAVEAVATVLALREGVAPPTLNYEEPDEDCDLDYVPEGPRSLAGANGDGGGADGRRLVAISNAFGFGGHNAVLCLAAP
ncbi:MAG: beta-ketoacyl-[acyl-carrier-protein] synthase II [Actinomycetota bacterium]|nr:beta-ketoacyl-[acyl-carrier-protein] synthase II [Actinomycetota bacterium]